jgi:hypothetical protein
MKTTTIVTIIAIVGAVATSGLISVIGLSTPAHAAACNTHFDSQTGESKEQCSSQNSLDHANAFNDNNHIK